VNRRSPVWLALALLGVGAVAYVRSRPAWLYPSPGPSPDSKPLTRGTAAAPELLATSRARLEFAIFHLPAPKAPPAEAVAKLIPAHFPGLRMTESGEGAILPALTLSQPAPAEYAPPEANRNTWRGVSDADKAAVATCTHVTLLRFYTAVPALEDVRRAELLALELAKATGGLLWDEDTAEVFTPETWKQRRLDTWSGGYPEAAWNLMMHTWTDDKGVIRLATTGMRKFGLPDLLIVNPPRSDLAALNDLLDATCQALIEQSGTATTGRFAVALADLKHRKYAEQLRAKSFPDAKGKSEVLFKPTDEMKDARNPVVEVVFPEDRGASSSERENAVLTELFGHNDEVTQVVHDDAILEASARAKVRLLGELKRRAMRGLSAGEQLLVKAPFKTASGGNEWMWVDVARWRAGVVEGTLANTPDDVPELKAGAVVKVNEKDLFDYIRHLPDGGTEGNETGALMKKLQSQ
jgi:uncharacterized protein YegJ (DUF2314 family)